MKRFLVGAAAVMVLMGTVAWAQQGPGDAPGRGGRGKGMWYDPAKVETVSGKVTEVAEFESRRGVHKGIHLTLDVAGKSMTVVVGPQAYLEQQKVKFAAGDSVEVRGVKSTRRGQELFIAGSITRDGQELKLRDESGRPLWAGTGPGPAKKPRRAAVGC